MYGVGCVEEICRCACVTETSGGQGGIFKESGDKRAVLESSLGREKTGEKEEGGDGGARPALGAS